MTGYILGSLGGVAILAGAIIYVVSKMSSLADKALKTSREARLLSEALTVEKEALSDAHAALKDLQGEIKREVSARQVVEEALNELVEKCQAIPDGGNAIADRINLELDRLRKLSEVSSDSTTGSGGGI